MAPNKIEIFFSYSNVDVKLRDELAKHLRGLERKGVITAWHESEISAGKESTKEIENHLNSASIILLLVSPDYISSDELWQREVTQAMKRHEQKEARVIPVLLRDYHGWEEMPFGKLQPLPKNGKPITDETWQNQDAAFKDVVEGIQQAVKEISKHKILADPTKPFIRKLFFLIPWFSLFKTFSISAGVTLIVLILRSFVGIFEPSELWFYDQMMRHKVAENPDKHLLVVEVTKQNIDSYNNSGDSQIYSGPRHSASLSDGVIYKLLNTLLEKKAAVIGLDIYRNFKAYDKNLQDLFKDNNKSKRLIFICKVEDKDAKNPGVNPPPDIPEKQVGFSDLLFDRDGVVRRQLLKMQAIKKNKNDCGTTTKNNLMDSFAFKVAQQYLQETKNTKFTLEDKNESLNYKNKDKDIDLEPLDVTKQGGYSFDDKEKFNGHQILLNYRRSPKLSDAYKVFETTNISSIIEGKINDDLVKGKIVLIGVNAEGSDSISPTPFSTGGVKSQSQMWGLYIQAQKVSQIVNAALENRRLITVWSLESEILWMITWGIAGAVIVQFFKKPKQLVIAAGIGIFCLYIFCLGIFIFPTTKTWIPFTPTVVVFLGSIGIMFIMDVQSVQLKEKRN